MTLQVTKPYRRTRISKAAGLVKQECANCRHGHCLEDGTRIGDERPRCLVMSGLPCAYFDRCLAPLCVRHAVWEGALADYFRITAGWEGRENLPHHRHLGHDPKINAVTNPATRHCQCGSTLDRGRRKCDACRRKATRNRVARHRAQQQGQV